MDSWCRSQKYITEECILKTALIFSAVDQRGIDQLKLLLNSRELYTIEQDHYTILQHVILHRNREVFDFLLSIEDFPLDTTSCNDENLTALIMSLGFYSGGDLIICEEYFALELLKKGADMHQIDSKGNSVLHLAIKMRYESVCRYILERGIDVDHENDGKETALRVFLENCHEFELDKNILFMLLYYNADLSPKNDPELALDLFNWALLAHGRFQKNDIQEILFYYIKDLVPKIKIPLIDVLHIILEPGKDWFVRELLHHDKVELIAEPHSSLPLSNLFRISSDWLTILINKYESTVGQLLVNLVHDFWAAHFVFSSRSIDNFEILLKNPLLASPTLDVVSVLKIEDVISNFADIYDIESLFDLIFYLLSYGIQVYKSDLDVVYNEFGYCNLFRTLLYMNIKESDECFWRNIIPAIFYDVSVNKIAKFLKDPHNFSLNALERLLEYCSRQELKNLCFNLNRPAITDKAKKLPKVPSLVELARDSCRAFIIKKYGVKTSCEFYTILKWLCIPDICKKIICYEKALYLFD